MYRFYTDDSANKYHYEELCRVFLRDDDFEIIDIAVLPDPELLGDSSNVLGYGRKADRDSIKRELYRLLRELTRINPKWGTLTGVRPLKPAVDILDETGSIDEMKAVIKTRYLLSDDKSDLISDIADYQASHINKPAADSVSIYTGIPFCPTRCEYCSFASNVAGAYEISKYMDDLAREIDHTGRLFAACPKDVESVYIGGGTPTTLDAGQLGDLIDRLSAAFCVRADDVEFTVEAGRPDTIDESKLEAIKSKGINRISINPQTMKDSTLRLIGRDHSSQDIRDAFRLAHKVSFDVINADLIAGLPEETYEDFAASLDEIIDLGADNITVHTLSVKRGSRLHEHDPEFYRRDIERVGEMLDYSRRKLKECSYYPYYIYRQKHQIGAFENVGYCKENKHSIYNIRIMEDKQSIIALGAGGVGKLYYPDEDRIERIANVSNYKIYSERIDEMLARKNKYFGG